MYVAFLMGGLLLGQDPTDRPDEAQVRINAQWSPILDGIAAEYELTRASDKVRLERQSQSVYKWAWPGPHAGNCGEVYVWTNHGNAEAVACIWRASNNDGTFTIFHELHSLSPAVLKSSRVGPMQWTTKAGLPRQLAPDAPEPAATSAGRLEQMRDICQKFTAHSVSASGKRFELRLFLRPLYRYQSSDPDIVDGALFTFFPSLGKDPEIFLQLEARQTGNAVKWYYTLARFSHHDLFVSYQDREIWTSIRNAENPLSQNPAQTYWLFSEPYEAHLPKPKTDGNR